MIRSDEYVKAVFDETVFNIAVSACPVCSAVLKWNGMNC
jgi:hypothetical protein